MTDSGWRDDYGAGREAWEAVIDEAVEADDPERTPYRLAEILLREDPNLRMWSRDPQFGLPPGSMTFEQIRKAAEELDIWATKLPSVPESDTWHVISQFDGPTSPPTAHPPSRGE